MTPRDLAFILQQIKISEQHAANPARTASNPCAGLLGSGPNQIPSTGQGVELPWGLRTVDGSCNNLLPGKEYFGTAGKPFPTLVDPVKEGAESGDADGPGPAPNGPTSYQQTSGFVIDSEPRVISNLIADQTATNPAAVEAAGENPEIDPTTGTYSIPNTAPDVGLSAPYNTWFTLFGQFFDHGLDLTGKGGRGTVYMPLKPDDPLYVDGSPTNFMLLTRATTDASGKPVNSTSSFVDQSQTYSSHPSHQVFLREYANDGGGKPQSTGALITGPKGGMANWDAVQAQARNLLGINLVDTDVARVPLLATDPYGKFLRGPNGYPQLVTSAGLVEGNPAAPVNASSALPAGEAFLDDISNFAVPGPTDHDRNPATPRVDAVPDADQGTTDDGSAATYDDEMLGAHFIAGDGRVNENIGLTAVHHVFHSEHNRLVDNSDAGTADNDPTDIKTVIQDYVNSNPASPLFPLADWQRADGEWDGERLFQAAKFITEMEYQHLAFEEFARKVQPLINLFGEGGTGYNTSINPSVRGEFAHAVYRFGHSMLTETVPRKGAGAGATTTNTPLLQAFLNPPAFMPGTTTPEQAAGNIVRGTTRQVGNEIDEFVTDALRNELLGLPLDLPALNMARARETGTPGLNAARRAFYATSNNTALAPYESWADFQFAIRNPGSLVNFIAAYGTHSSITSSPTMAGKRSAANALLYGVPGPDGELLTADDIPAASVPADSYDFLNSVGAHANGANGVTTTGVDDIDLWMGGLAERQVVFGGLLGPTFNYVFEKQMEDLQNGDRFYYLSRTVSQNLLVQLEGNSFSELISRNTDVVGLPADSFSRPDLVFDMAAQNPSGAIVDDPDTTDYNETQQLTRMADGTIRYGKVPGAHTVFNGTAGNDRMWAGEGDDTMRGNDGNDRIQGGDGVDSLIGGLGDDILLDLAGDDTLKGGDGNDALSSGQGFGGDLNQSGRGNDFVLGGNDITETFAGLGDDFVFGGDADDTVFGDEGNDWIEGGTGNFNLLQGDNGAPFQDDATGGHDTLIGYGGEQDYDAEGGDDVMLGGPGLQRAEGMLGFDWFTHDQDPSPTGADSDMAISVLLPPSVETNKDRFDLVEAMSGGDKADVLRGDDRVATDMDGHALNAAGIARTPGVAGLLPAGATGFTGGNILIGGAGGDTIEGRGGNDIIDGDAYLNVRISVRDANTGATEVETVDTMAGVQARVLAGSINPGRLRSVREILTPADAAAVDTAVFSGARAEYDITFGTGSVTVTHARGLATDGTDTVRNTEQLRFSDVTIPTTAPVNPAPTVTAQGPAANATAAAVGTNVTATFSEAVTGVSGTTFQVVNVATNAVVAAPAPTSNAAGTLWTLNPNANLAAGTQYRVTLTGGNTAIRDLAGAPLATTSWTFTTAAPVNPAPTVTARAPAVNATVVGLAGNVTATFSEPVNGVSGTTFQLRNAAGALVAGTVTRNGTTNQWILNPNADLAADTRYTVTLTGGATAIRDVPGAPLATTSWSFLTGPRPALTARTPGVGATGVGRTANVTATFNEAVNPATVNATNVTLRTGTAVTGALQTAVVSYNATTRVLTLNPNATLAANTQFTVRLGAGITDTAGNPLLATQWSFTTGP